MERLRGESAVVLPVCRFLLFICCAKRRAISFTHVLEGGQACAIISHISTPPTVFSGQTVVAVWRGVVAGCVRIFSQEYVHEK